MLRWEVKDSLGEWGWEREFIYQGRFAAITKRQVSAIRYNKEFLTLQMLAGERPGGSAAHSHPGTQAPPDGSIVPS